MIEQTLLQAAALLHKLGYYFILPLTDFNFTQPDKSYQPVILSVRSNAYTLRSDLILSLQYKKGQDLTIQYKAYDIAKILSKPCRDQLYILNPKEPQAHPLRFLMEQGSLPAIYAIKLLDITRCLCALTSNKYTNDADFVVASALKSVN